VEITFSFHRDKYTFNLYGIYSNYNNRKDLCNFHYHFFGLYLRISRDKNRNAIIISPLKIRR